MSLATLANDLVDAVGAWLQADAGVIAAFGTKPVKIRRGDFDEASLPYLAIGEDELRRADVGCLALFEVTVRVHCWTREPSGTMCRAVLGAAAEALTITQPDGSNRPLTVPDFELISGFQELQRYLRDPKPNVSHGVADFTFRFKRVSV
jgi:hypothetical protein